LQSIFFAVFWVALSYSVKKANVSGISVKIAAESFRTDVEKYYFIDSKVLFEECESVSHFALILNIFSQHVQVLPLICQYKSLSRLSNTAATRVSVF
jgi:hypothetical protein